MSTLSKFQDFARFWVTNSNTEELKTINLLTDESQINIMPSHVWNSHLVLNYISNVKCHNCFRYATNIQCSLSLCWQNQNTKLSETVTGPHWSETQFEIQSEKLKSLIRGKNTGLDTHYTYTVGLCSYPPAVLLYFRIKFKFQS